MVEARIMRRCRICGQLYYPTQYRDFCGEYCHSMYMRAQQQREYEMRRRQQENSFRSKWEKIGKSNIGATGRFSKKFKFPRVRDMEA